MHKDYIHHRYCLLFLGLASIVGCGVSVQEHERVLALLKNSEEAHSQSMLTISQLQQQVEVDRKELIKLHTRLSQLEVTLSDYRIFENDMFFLSAMKMTDERQREMALVNFCNQFPQSTLVSLACQEIEKCKFKRSAIENKNLEFKNEALSKKKVDSSPIQEFSIDRVDMNTTESGVTRSTKIGMDLQSHNTGEERSDNSLLMKFCFIPSGKFNMGSPKTEKNRNADESQVEVIISKGFYLGKFEVTQGEWKKMMRSEPWRGKENTKIGSNYPATFINWVDANKFCEQFSATEGKRFRLPTEAEWEYACRAGTTTTYSFGDDLKKMNDFSWYGPVDNEFGLGEINGVFIGGSAKGEKYPHLVGTKKPNPWGLHDMHGNVSEWCIDWYGKQLRGGRDPQDPAEGSDAIDGANKVTRGGTYESFPHQCRSAVRSSLESSTERDTTGFRVVFEVQ